MREYANAQNEPGTKQADDLLHAVDIGETVTSPDHALEIWRSIRALATPQHMLDRTRAMFTGTVQRALMITPTPIANGDALLAAELNRAPVVAAADAASQRRLTFADLPPIGRPGRMASRAVLPALEMERWQLSNGVTALVRSTNIEPNKIRITVRWGAGRMSVGPQQRNLLWTAGGALLESGIGRLDQNALDRLVNGRQIGMGFDVDDDAFELSAETRPEDLADQLRLLATKLAVPGWQGAPVVRARAGQLAAYDLIRNSPMAVMRNELPSLLFSGDTRYAPPTRADVEALTPASFRAFWEPRMRQGPIEIQIFGDVGNVDLQSMLLSTFGAMPARRAPALPVGANDLRPTPVATAPIIARHSGGDTQAAAILAYHTGGGLDDIRTARQLEILAAIFNDRLFERLRDQAGASYSQAVNSNWSADFAHGGYVFVGGLVRPEDSDLMLRSAHAIAAELMASPVSADELQRAVGPASEQIIRAASGNVFWMYELEGATREPRRIEALRSYLTDLTGVTPADLQALARRYLAPERAVTVLVLPDGAAVPALSPPGTVAGTAGTGTA
ncbi:MAG: M16 family metallopeptidase, partial [Sphingopyxis sp.]